MTLSARHRSVEQQRREALELELRRFVDFGTLLDRRTRRYLAAILRQRALGDPPPLVQPAIDDENESLDATYTLYFTRALDQLFGHDELLNLCRAQGTVGLEVATETLRWMRRVLNTLDRTDPHAEERARLRGVAGLPLTRFIATQRSVLGELEGWYGPDQLDIGFYRSTLAEACPPHRRPTPAEAERVERLLHDLLSNWDALLSAKRLADQMGQLTEARERFTKQLHARIDEHKQVRDVLSPFVDYLDRGWDLSRELWDQADLDLLQAYADLLEHEDDLRRLAELLGRMHDAETRSEEEELSRTIHTERWVSDPTQRTEIVGIRTSDELPHVLTSEFALSGDPLLEDRFLQKLADKRLLSFAFSDRRKVTDTHQLTEVHTHTRRRVKGPFILCVDTSYSMAGDAERLAKVLAFGILRVAIEEDREAYLINFSVQIRTMDLRNVGRNLDELAAFLRMSFHGGTDVTLAFTEAIRKLDEGRYADADVLVVSDFIMLRMSAGVLDDVRSHQHNNGTRFHALTFQDRPSSELQSCFDTVWASDPDHPGTITELAAQMQTIRSAGATLT